jgi:putative intracellular protease/amidase
MKVLFITTSHNKPGPTDGWLEDLAVPYYVFMDAGAEVTIASPNGGPLPLPHHSQSIIIVTRKARHLLNEAMAMNFLSHSILLEDARADEFDVVFMCGGHGALWDLADNSSVKRLLEAFNNSGKPIGAVGHGVAGLLSAQNKSGMLLVKGKRLTGFSNSEERRVGSTEAIPFLLADTLRSLGAIYTSTTDCISYVVADDNIITGQNPASSEEVAQRIVAWYSIIKKPNLVAKPENV